MTNLRKAAEMALDALEKLTDGRIFTADLAGYYGGVKGNLRQAIAKPEQSKYSDIVSDGGLDPRNKFDAQPEQEQRCVNCGKLTMHMGNKCYQCCQIAHPDNGFDRTASHMAGEYVDTAQPEQEPVAWRNAAIRLGEDLYSVGPDGYYDMTAKQWLDWALSVVTAPPSKSEKEPYGYVWTSVRDGMEVRFSRMFPNDFYKPQDIKPVYTAPPKREWQGLTDEEIPTFDYATPQFLAEKKFARAIEAKLREKNT